MIQGKIEKFEFGPIAADQSGAFRPLVPAHLRTPFAVLIQTLRDVTSCLRKWSGRNIATWICCQIIVTEKLNKWFYLITARPRWQLLNTPEWMTPTAKTSFLPAGKRDPLKTDGFIMPSERLTHNTTQHNTHTSEINVHLIQERGVYSNPRVFFWCDWHIINFSHEEMKTQWEHPKTGRKKRCAGGINTTLIVINQSHL